MPDYSTTKARVFQWLGIILIIGVFAGAYWYFQVYGSTINQSKNDLVTNGLIGLWSFDGGDISGTTAYDRSGNGFDGTIVAAPGRIKGKVGQALSISDTQYVTVADTATLDVGDTADLTLSGWVASRNASVTNTVIAKRNGVTAADVGYILYMDVSSGKLVFEVSDGTDEYSLTSTEVFTSSARWIHFVVVWDQDSAANSEIYIDGVSNSATDSGTIGNIGDLSNALTFRVGSESDTNNALRGSVDEVRAYNRVLSAGEIQSLYAQGGGTRVDSSVSQAQGTGRLDSGLVGYWGLDDGIDDGSSTSATDSSTNGNTGTLTNGPTWTTGQIGGAVNFDGTDDHITAGAPTALNMTGTMTVSAWIYPETFGGGGGKGRIVDKDSNATTGFIFSVDNVTVASGFAFMVNTTVAPRFLGAANTITLNTWQHVTATLDGNKIATLYKNGMKVASASVSELPTTGSNNFVIGGRTSDNLRNFDGSIDEVRVYNRALSAEEAANLYRLTAPTGVDTSLNGYWPFNGQDFSGTTAFDRSGGNNNGTLTGGPTKVKGKVGQALDFDDTNDYVSIADNAMLDATDTADLTLSGWFYRDTATTDDTIIAKRTGILSTDTGYVAYIDDATDQLIFEVSDGTDEYSLTSNSTFTTTGWYQYAIVWDENSAAGSEIYINGVANNATDSGTIGNIGNISNAVVLAVGAASDAEEPFDGKLDETRIYSRVLSAGEIQSLYTQGGGAKVTSSISQSQGTGRLDSGLAGYWKLDDGSGSNATDSSTNGTTFGLTGSPTWTTGQIAGAIDLDGSTQYAAVASNDIFEMDGTENFSLSGWFNRDTATTTDTIFAKRLGTASNNAGYIVHLPGNTDQLTFEVSDGTDEYQLESVSTFTATGWHHFTVVWDESGASQTNLYIDGVQESVTRTGTFTNVGSLANSVSVVIGMDSNSSLHFDGKLDEIRLYSRALSGDEAAQLYRLATPTGADTSLKGYWSFNGQDVSGTTAYDRSGSGNVGTLTSGPTKVRGKIGQALSFDNTDDYVDLGSNASVDDLAVITVTAWVKPNSTGGGTLAKILNKATSASGGWEFGVCAHASWGCSGSDTRLRFYRWFSGAAGDWNSAASSLQMGVWQHVAIVYDSGSSTNDPIFYIDGSVSATTEFSTPSGTASSDASQTLTIGNRPAADRAFDGVIDEVRLYNRALSAAEIAALYNQSR
ncbi:MAG: LamG domain-containing protein [Candidatus Moraniibacteriota bacterium]